MLAVLVLLWLVILAALKGDMVQSQQEQPYTVLMQGENVTITCNVTSSSNVTWTVDMMEISSERDLMIPYFNESSITGGYYICTDDMEDIVDMALVGFSPLFIEEPSGNVETSVNMTVILNCTAAGSPVPRVAWKRLSSIDLNTTHELPSGSALNNSVNISFYSNRSSLTIEEVQYEDYGYYVCVAMIGSFKPKPGMSSASGSGSVTDSGSVSGSDMSSRLTSGSGSGVHPGSSSGLRLTSGSGSGVHSGSSSGFGLTPGSGSDVHSASGSDFGLTSGSGSSVHSGSSSGFGLTSGVGSGVNSGSSSGFGLTSGSGSGVLLGPSSGFGLTSGIGSGVQSGSSSGFGLTSGSGEIDADSGSSSGFGLFSGLESGTDTDFGLISGSGSGTGSGSELDLGSTIDPDSESNLGFGLASGSGSGSYSGSSSGFGLISGSGSGTSSGSDLASGSKLNLGSGSNLVPEPASGSMSGASSGSGSVPELPSISSANTVSGSASGSGFSSRSGAGTGSESATGSGLASESGLGTVSGSGTVSEPTSGLSETFVSGLGSEPVADNNSESGHGFNSGSAPGSSSGLGEPSYSDSSSGSTIVKDISSGVGATGSGSSGSGDSTTSSMTCVYNMVDDEEYAICAPVILSVSPKGSISALPPVNNSTDGDDVQFTCTAQGGPGNQFVWRYERTGEIVSSTQQLNLTSDESVGGQYQCEVFNMAGNDTASVTLNVGPEILQGPQAQNVTNFEGIVLKCNVSGFPIPSVTWLHNNIELMEEVPRVNITVEYNNESSTDPTQFGRAVSTIMIDTPNVNDSGDYACQATISSIASYDPVTSANVTVLVQMSPKGSISALPPVNNSTDGDDVQFTCTAQGGPGNQFVWRYERTGEIVSFTQQLNLTSDESVGGQYQCEVSNMAGNDTASVTLNVGPEILQGPQAQNVTDYEDAIVLTCNVSGFPIPSITWWHNSTKVMEEVPRVNIATVQYNSESSSDPTQFGRAVSTIMIGTPNVNDSGDYACQATTSSIASYDPVTSANVTVLVQSCPRAVVDLMAVNVTSRNFTLTWMLPCAEISRMEEYMVQFSDPPFLNGTQRILNSSNEQLFIYNLHPGVTYNFVVTALNESGSSFVGDSLMVTTLDEAPTSPPALIVVSNNNGSSARNITVNWVPIPDLERNGELLFYEVLVVSFASTRVKREIVPNSHAACFAAANASPNFSVSVAGDQTNITLEGLTPNSNYTVQVRGNTTAGYSNFSDPLDFKTGEDVPEQPHNVTLSSLNSSSLFIQWTEPTCDNGIRKRYEISYNNITDMSSLGSKKSPFDQGSNTDEVTIKDLTPNTNYTVTVRACTAVGCGEGITGSKFTSQDAPQAVADLALTLMDTSIVLSWVPPSDRNGTFDYSITFNARSSFNYPNYPDRIQEDSESNILLLGSNMSYTLENVLAFANYEMTITPFNRLLGIDFSGPTLNISLQSPPQAPSTVTSPKAITENSDSVLIQWGLPMQPNGTITDYIVSIENELHFIPSSDFFYSLDGLDPGKIIAFGIYAQIDSTIVLKGETTSLQVILNTTVPFSGAELIDSGISTLTISLPPATLYPGNGDIVFYGLVLVKVLEGTTRLSEVVDFGVEYPNPMPYQEGQTTHYYLTAAWNSIDNVPDTFIVGDNTETTATYQGIQHVFVNKGLSRRTPYHLFVIVHVDSGVPDHPLIRFSSVIPSSAGEVETRLGYNEAALGFFMALLFVLIIAIVIVIVILVLFQRKRRKTEGYELTAVNGEHKTIPEAHLVVINPPATEMVDKGSLEPSSSKDPIPVEDFPAYVENMHSSDNYLFTIEFPTLEPKHSPKCTATSQPENSVKNRYANITAYDHSRVKLKEIPNVPGSDYINANYIDGYNEENAFIAAQGPVAQSILDFWRMIWEQETAIIVMLTGLEEKGRVKCCRYWPSEGKPTKLYGNIEVTLKESLVFNDHTIRTFSIQDKEFQDMRTVVQYHFTAWPDFGVPEHPTALLRFARKVRTCKPASYGPMVVHCSAGVGRTGTFCTILSQMKRMSDVGTVDIFNYVQSMRYRRCFMVQTESQYMFIHDAMLEALECGETEVLAKNFKDQYFDHGNVDPDSGKTFLEIEFGNVGRTIHQEFLTTSGSLPCNKKKNRYNNILPYENNRCRLDPIPNVEGSDYINASYIKGYQKDLAFLATQGPLTVTICDFWRMVFEQKAASIVMLAQEREGGKTMCCQYWLDEGSEIFGQLEVSLQASMQYPEYTLREFKMVDTKDQEGAHHLVKQFQYTGWPSKGVPDNASGLIDLRDQVERWQRNSGDNPIVVHCSGGCGRTGTFIAICLLIERLKTEGVVDVFQTVRALRLQRPGMVRSKEQYEFCYRAILEYLETFDEYANFSDWDIHVQDHA